MSDKSHLPSGPASGDSPDIAGDQDLEKLNHEIEMLKTQVAEQAEEIHRLNELVETDPLTGIANRRSFEKEIHRRYAEQQRGGNGFCLMFVDVDDLKRINDEFGHTKGDRLLCSIASVMESNFRTSDIVFRIGGDEFSVLLPGATREQAEVAANRLIGQTVALIQSQTGEIPVGLSVGLVESVGDRTIGELVDAADQAMYQAKQQGGNRFMTAQDKSQKE